MSAVFSIVIIPDTQMYVERNPEIFLNAQMDWIIDHQFDADKNIIYVAHLGDLKDDPLCDNQTITLDDASMMSEWAIVRAAFDKLEAATSVAFPDGIPYGLLPGNHDFEPVSGFCPHFNIDILPRPLTVDLDGDGVTYNLLFGPDTFDSDITPGTPKSYYGGSRLAGDNDDNYTLFSAGGVKFIAINLGYRGDANALGSLDEVAWTDARLKEFDDRIGIVTSHYVLDCNLSSSFSCGGGPGFVPNNFGNWAAQLYSGIADNPNLMMMMGAHRFGEAYRVEDRIADGMQPVHVLLFDYQELQYPAGDPASVATFRFVSPTADGFGNTGFMRIMTFDTDTGIVTTKTFSPADVAPLVGQPDTGIDLESIYFPYQAELSDGVLTTAEIATINTGTAMKESTASNLRFSFEGYVDTASSVFIDFDARQDGTAYVGVGDFFPADEYDGVVINDSDPASGSTFVNLVVGNVGADISGYHVNIGAFAVTPQTQLTLDFTAVVTEVSFDFASPGGILTVTAFDASAAPLGVFNFNGTDLFTTQTGAALNAGRVDISGTGEIASLVIEPSPSTVLIIDNLNFTSAGSP